MKLPDNLNEDFSHGALGADTLSKDPFEQFERWFSEICEIDPDAPNAVSLATASRLGIPSVRTVLMKIYDINGFVFFTNYTNRLLYHNNMDSICISGKAVIYYM